MGMDLKPLRPTPNAPLDDRGFHQWGHYNWTGWEWLIEHLEQWGVNTGEFVFLNDGKAISEETCLRVANAIEVHLSELEERHQKWLEPHIRLWRTCGGYAQR